ncbi:uncharacterized protein IWZ02DRAFT_432761 [Phyllosticta citriasiana]|uniref:uncharacterized protein n=1 Tax=Phyllosticta citriasiana TaxID=595635 RepID=UPI0030FD44E5
MADAESSQAGTSGAAPTTGAAGATGTEGSSDIVTSNLPTTVSLSQMQKQLERRRLAATQAVHTGLLNEIVKMVSVHKAGATRSRDRPLEKAKKRNPERLSLFVEGNKELLEGLLKSWIEQDQNEPSYVNRATAGKTGVAFRNQVVQYLSSLDDDYTNEHCDALLTLFTNFEDSEMGEIERATMFVARPGQRGADVPREMAGCTVGDPAVLPKRARATATSHLECALRARSPSTRNSLRLSTKGCIAAGETSQHFDRQSEVWRSARISSEDQRQHSPPTEDLLSTSDQSSPASGLQAIRLLLYFTFIANRFPPGFA